MNKITAEVTIEHNPQQLLIDIFHDRAIAVLGFGWSSSDKRYTAALRRLRSEFLTTQRRVLCSEAIREWARTTTVRFEQHLINRKYIYGLATKFQRRATLKSGAYGKFIDECSAFLDPKMRAIRNEVSAKERAEKKARAKAEAKARFEQQMKTRHQTCNTLVGSLRELGYEVTIKDTKQQAPDAAKPNVDAGVAAERKARRQAKKATPVIA